MKQAGIGIAFAVLGAIIASTEVHADHAGPSAWWETDRPNCQIWNAHPQRDETIVWSGACREGKADGPGTVTWATPDSTGALKWTFNRGVLEAGKARDWSDTQQPDCWVKFNSLTAFDLTWSGPCAGGRAQGQGALAWSYLTKDGAQESGHFDGHIQGGVTVRGVMSWSNGARREGEWLDGLFTGKGIAIYSDGRYEGAWKHGKRNGQGTFTGSNGVRYDGSWLDDGVSGQGTLVWPNGDRYVGAFENGKRNGTGTITWADGNRYEGSWTDDLQNGSGVLILASGYRYVGEWVNGRKHGQGEQTWPNGNHYVGQFVNDSAHGQGVFTWANGDRHDGSWAFAKSNGYGVFTTAKGDRYEGNWQDDRPEGFGEAWIDGHHYIGNWVSGCIKDGTWVGAISRPNSECQ